MSQKPKKNPRKALAEIELDVSKIGGFLDACKLTHNVAVENVAPEFNRIAVNLADFVKWLEDEAIPALKMLEAMKNAPTNPELPGRPATKAEQEKAEKQAKQQ